jgi:glycosyltransferase involved in cell wall biosynthesis
MVPEIELLDSSDSISTRSRASANSGCAVASPPKTLRVLHVINGEHYAGAERVQDLLAARLPEFGTQVHFVCVKPDRFPAARHCQTAPLTSMPMRFRFDLRPAWRMARMIREQHFDLIHTHTPRAIFVGAIASRLTGVPLVHHVHGHTAVEVGSGWRLRVAAEIESISLARASAVIAVSPTAAKYIEHWGVPAERIHVVPNGVPGRTAVADRPTPPSVWTIGMVALLRPRKGLEVLLNALSQLHDRGVPIQLRVIGGFETPEYEREVRQLANELNVKDIVQWRGFQSDINRELDALDLLAFPSVLPEGMPMALMEAMAAGVPPIGSRVAGNSELIDHGHNGLLVEPNEPAALAREIQAVIDNQFNWQSLRSAAIETHKLRFSDRAMAANVAKVYRQLLRQPENSRKQ